MIEMTKAQWEMIPADMKRKRKDGTRVVLVTRGDEKKWTPVTWKS